MLTQSGHFTPNHATQLSFINRPDGQFDTIVDVSFHAPDGKVWTAPAGTITDGASIPGVVADFFGGKLNHEFLFAAIVHDAYCGESNAHLPVYQAEKWEETHRMFYHACLANGTRRLKAKVMYAGVRLGGPRWSFNERPFNDLSSVSDTVIRQEMEYCKQWIEAQEESLSLEAIDQWMDEREAEILK